MMKHDQTQIVIIGAGYAGLIAARRLAWKTSRNEVAITLVNGTERFVERINLHKFAANQPVGQPMIQANLRKTGVHFVQGWVTGIQPAECSLTIQTGSETSHLNYDYLLFALGSTMDREGVPGVREHAYVLTPSGERSAQVLRERLPQLNQTRGDILICGGGATGIESAAEFADNFPGLRIRLVTQGTFGDFIRPEIAAYMARSLRRRGVIIQDHTSILEVRANLALTSSGETIPFDLCLWTGGFKALPLARETGLKVNKLGQILVDPYMRSISHPEIYAAGDAAQPVEEPGAPMRMCVFTSLVTGVHAADCLSDILSGKTPRPLSFAYPGMCIALGRTDAIAFNIYPTDKARPPIIGGRAGYFVREAVVRYYRWLLRAEARPGRFYALGKGRYAATKSRVEGQLLKMKDNGS